MISKPEALARLHQIANLRVIEDAPLSRYTRFGIGGPASIYVETANRGSFAAALAIARESGWPHAVIGSGTNLVVSDAGFPGIVLKYTARNIQSDGELVAAEAGAELQELVDYTIVRGLKGLETMTGIPGSLGAAIYGNAGAYGHSIMERIYSVEFHDGVSERVFGNPECEFQYRESIFKRRKNWIIFSAQLRMERGDALELQRTAAQIRKIREEKYPAAMRCAGSIFKNLILAGLPESVRRQVPPQVVREGKVPAAYFLEQAGAKGLRNGDIHVADYHANLIYNAGQGTARELIEVVTVLKQRVYERFGLELEEEVQYIGFEPAALPAAG